MKILVIQDRLRSGGTERQSILLTRAFRAAGHQARLLTFRPGGALAAGAADLAPHSLQPFDFGLDWFAPGLLRRGVFRFPSDIVLCMGRMANCYGADLQKNLGDGDIQNYAAGSVICTMRTGKNLPWFYRRSLRACRHVIANSRDARDAVAALGVPDGKISTIHNPLVFPPPAESRREEVRASQGAGPGTLVLLSVAMFRPEKNQRELIEAAAGLPAGLDWQLWLAGDGPVRRDCARLAERLGVAARLRFLGLQADPAPLYAAADLAVHASWSESLSNFLIEAQAAGLPGIAYEARGIGECFVPGRTGWVIPRGDRAAFRAAIERLAAEPAPARRTRAEEARVFARTTFDPDRQVAAYLKLFSLMAGDFQK